MGESKILPSTNHTKGGYTLMTGYQGKARTSDGEIKMDDVTYNLEYTDTVIQRIGAVYFVALFYRSFVIVLLLLSRSYILCRLTN